MKKKTAKQPVAWKHSASTKEGRIERAVYVLRDPCKVPIANRLDYLKQKGLSEIEIMEAMNEASGGVLVEAAFS